MTRFLIVPFTLFLLEICAGQTAQASAGDRTSVVGQSKDTTTTSSSPQNLNEIRFGGWTDKDWYDNEYFRVLRRYLDACYKGEIEDQNLAPYRSILNSRFVIGDASPFILGGLYVSIVFLEAPEKTFTTWIYSGVDEETETVVDYEVRGFTIKGPYNMTKEEILTFLKECPEHKLW